MGAFGLTGLAIGLTAVLALVLGCASPGSGGAAAASNGLRGERVVMVGGGSTVHPQSVSAVLQEAGSNQDADLPCAADARETIMLDVTGRESLEEVAAHLVEGSQTEATVVRTSRDSATVLVHDDAGLLLSRTTVISDDGLWFPQVVTRCR